MRDKRHNVDMINGPIFSKMVVYALPIVASAILQLLYNAADVAVVGRFAGSAALAAVGSTTSLINLFVNFFVGISVGVRVVVSQFYGAGNKNGVRLAVHTAIPLAAVSGVALAVIGFFASKVVLQLMGSPPEVINLSALYLKIYFLGVPATLILNFGTSILGAAGDTRRPMYIMMVSGIINVGLNLIFVITFRMSVAGVALATIISQYFSALVIMWLMMRSNDHYKLSLRKMRFYPQMLKKIICVGVPAGIQSTVFSFSNVIIQSSINSFGSLVMAGNAAAQSAEGFIFTSMNSFYQATMTFTGQNVGARKLHRISKIYLNSIVIVTVLGLSMGAVINLFAKPILSVFTDDPAVIPYGRERLLYLGLTYFLCGLMEVTVGMLRGMGRSLMPMLVAIGGVCGIRIVWVAFVTAAGLLIPDKPATVVWIYYSYPITWIVTTAVHFICYVITKRKLVKTINNQG